MKNTNDHNLNNRLDLNNRSDQSNQFQSFVAIDFETATSSPVSACSIGIVVFQNGQPIKQDYYLIQPPQNEYYYQNIKIHGINPEDTINQPTFDQIWPLISDYFDSSWVVAHNAAFDMKVLKSTLTHYQLPIPDFKYFCSLRIGKQLVKGQNVKSNLHDLSQYLKIRLDHHHHALADAYACGMIIVTALTDYNPLQLTIQQYLTPYLKSFVEVKAVKHQERIYFQDSVHFSESVHFSDGDYFDQSDLIFHGKVFAFSGELKRYSREEATHLVEEFGGKVLNCVNRNTDILVLTAKFLSTKLRKALELQQKGHRIRIINEQQFYQLIDQTNDF